MVLHTARQRSWRPLALQGGVNTVVPRRHAKNHFRTTAESFPQPSAYRLPPTASFFAALLK
jgi:hypothetical protein